MNSLPVVKKYYAQIPAALFIDWRPTADATIRLDLLLYRVIDNALNPLEFNDSAVGSEHALPQSTKWFSLVAA